MRRHCDGCTTVTGSQFHCGVCHQTFGGLRSFDRHRTGVVGQRLCIDAAELGLICKNGVWREQIDPESLRRITGGSHGNAA